MSFTKKILLSMVVAITVGIVLQISGQGALAQTYIAPGGRVFLNLIKFIVCPLVLFSVMGGVVSMDDIKKVGITGAKTLVVFFVTSATAVGFAIAVALALKGLFQKLNVAATAVQASASPGAVKGLSITEMLLNVFPDNFAAPFIQANMLQIIVMAVILAIAIILVGGETGRKLVDFVKSADTLFVTSLDLIMRLSPLGVFCLMCPVVAENGAEVIGSLAKVIGVAYFCYAVHLTVFDTLFVWIFSGIRPFEFLKKMAPALVFAFTSSSSVGTLPINMACAKKLGVNDSIANFVLPLGATINMNGTVIYHGVCAVFVAACYGVELSMGQIGAIVLTSTLASIGTAGVPGAGVVMLAMVLAAAGIPIDGIALVAGIDRIFDMGRTVLNISGDTVAAMVITGRKVRHEG